MELTIRINTRFKSAKTFLEFIKSLNFVEIVEEHEPNETTKKAMRDAENGKVKKLNFKDIDNIADAILNS